MLLTVFTPTYNRAYTLPKLYESLKRQTSRDFEWLIVDDGSSDGTRKLVEGWIDAEEIDIRYIYQENGGKPSAHNRGAREALGELFICVDSDDYLTDNAVEVIKSAWTDADEGKVGIIAYKALASGECVTRIADSEVKSFTLKGGYDITVITANFAEKDPNAALTEINVRRSCFVPEKTGLNYITVKGFEIAHAATPWAPPTADQIGMIGPHWAKGWIIEDNIIHDARCSAVSLGKEVSTGHNVYSRYHRKPGYNYQYEAMLAGYRMGWRKENIGSHIVRNNVIYNCGQNGVVGHMGGSYSEIYGNEIYHIGDRNEFWGHELGAIKLHALIDTQIHHNLIHDCHMGVWLDWQAQGARMSCNVFYRNHIDMKWEVTHGPHLVDNNILGSEQNFQNAAMGGAYVHNLFLGGMYHYEIIDRSTPYHLPHSTEMMGCSLVYRGDDRFYNNIFMNTQTAENRRFLVGLGHYNGAPDTEEEYIQTVWDKFGKCDATQFATVPQPVYTAHNYYGDSVPAYERDHTAIKSETASDAKITEENGNVYLEMTIDESFATLTPAVVDTKRLGMPRISEAPYENPDGSPITIDFDLFGNKRGEHPTAGPIENIGTGRAKILIAKRKAK